MKLEIILSIISVISAIGGLITFIILRKSVQKKSEECVVGLKREDFVFSTEPTKS